MKLYNKIGFFAAGALIVTSCAVNDPFADTMDIGEVVPTVSWELSSAVCKAGNETSFLAKYYTTEEGVSIDHSEVWGMITRVEVAAATQKLIKSPAYTLTISTSDTVRGSHMLQSYPHNLAELDPVNGREYHLAATFPTPANLAQVNWSVPSEWDDEKFNMYYPETFKSDFTAKMVDYLTKDSLYLGSLRDLYVAYDFTQEQFDAVNAKYATTIKDFKPLPWSDSQEQGKTKGDLWFDVDTKTIDHYYYTTLVGEITVENEVATIEEAVSLGIDPAKVYPVYKSPHWIFSRYSDNTGGAVTSVRAEYMPMWKELVALVPFEKWIYDSAEKQHAVDYTCKYTIVPKFKVFDTNGSVGTDTETKTVDLI